MLYHIRVFIALAHIFDCSHSKHLMNTSRITNRRICEAPWNRFRSWIRRARDDQRVCRFEIAGVEVVQSFTPCLCKVVRLYEAVERVDACEQQRLFVSVFLFQICLLVQMYSRSTCFGWPSGVLVPSGCRYEAHVVFRDTLFHIYNTARERTSDRKCQIRLTPKIENYLPEVARSLSCHNGY